MKDYFRENQNGVLSAKNINQAALALTQRLIVDNYLASPVLLNMVVATLLLYCNEDRYPLEKLVADCQTFYRYFQVRRILTIMTQPPTVKGVQRVLAGLGYKLKATQKHSANKTVK